MNRLPAAMMSLAIWLLPPGRKEWGQAMRGEFDLIDLNKTEFARGCFGAALKENIMSITGLARIGFVGLQLAAAALFSAWLWLFAGMLASQPTFKGIYLVFHLQWLLFGLVPIALGFCAFKAMRDPANRFYVASLVTAMVTNMALAFGMAWTVQFFGVLFLIPNTPSDTAGVTTSLVMGAIFGLFFLTIGILGRKSATSLRNAALLGLAVYVLGHVAVFLAIPQVKEEYYLLQATILGLPVVLLAIAGPILAWMQRPANPALQP